MSTRSPLRPPAVGHLACRREGAQHVLDLSGCRWVDPAHLAGAAAVAARHAAAGSPLRVVGPVRPDQRRYAARMHLGRVLDDLGVPHDLPDDVPERDRTLDLLEVRRVVGEDDAVALAVLVHGRTATTDPEAAAALHTGVAEVAQNVADHAGATGYVAAQVLPSAGLVRFAVADGGLGLRCTLADRGARGHRHALHLALDGTSRLPDPTRGAGLVGVVREVTRLRGSLYLASGSAAVRVTGAGRHVRADSALRTPFAGTLVEGVVGVRGAARPDAGTGGPGPAAPPGRAPGRTVGTHAGRGPRPDRTRGEAP
ncbi:hypothetical protein [Pseudokineococcus lusitanus]|uniref:STAS domain-containing protein n=1 Tax=Pseudokineococcus lusitanus TaxID=763993 RepID=A0A3N1G8D9_9ACTN|nr:hypothetical protein [Pseudokineococcus lusitanus]ROP26515.1 hypothetical protein EDC03_3438 [Pseudokineococcus lusitanus]